MFIDCLLLEDNTLIESDIAIIGGGMAGICLARELKNSGMSVCILESGGKDSSDKIEALNKGSVTIHSHNGTSRGANDYMHTSRNRFFGGTGNSWGGKCAQLDPFDFLEREWIEHSGWPIHYKDIKSYYDRACYMLHIPTFDSIQQSEVISGQIVLNANRNFKTSYRSFTGLTGEPLTVDFLEYKDGISKFSNTKIYLHANIASLEVNSSGNSIDGATIKCINHRTHTVKAKQFILCAGGIENVRILLNSNEVHRSGIGNSYDILGRYFNGHGIFKYLNGLNKPACTALLNSESHDWDLYTHKDPARIQAIFSLSKKAQWRERIAHFTATLDAQEAQGNEHAPIFFMLEQVPNFESRISLSDELDELGIARVHIDWHFTQQDTDTLSQGIKLFDRDLRKSGLGQIAQTKIEADISDIIECSRHHIGATRMGETAKTSVVDSDLKVHGISNLFVVGSSTFTTGGVANPTLTILALAIRLADKLKNNC